MAVPLDAIQAIHNAFRKDISAIDATAFSEARGGSGLDLVVKRYVFFNDILVWHAEGEENSFSQCWKVLHPWWLNHMNGTTVVSTTYSIH
jgi:hypothetical protein